MISSGNPWFDAASRKSHSWFGNFCLVFVERLWLSRVSFTKILSCENEGSSCVYMFLFSVRRDLPRVELQMDHEVVGSWIRGFFVTDSWCAHFGPSLIRDSHIVEKNYDKSLISFLDFLFLRVSIVCFDILIGE